MMIAKSVLSKRPILRFTEALFFLLKICLFNQSLSSLCLFSSRQQENLVVCGISFKKYS